MIRDCAICASSEKKYLYHQRFILPSANYFHAGYDVVICKRCGFAFADNLADQDRLDDYYRAMTKKTALLKRRMSEGYLEPEFVLRQHQHSANNIVPHLSKGDRLLDVGCYTGNLLHLLKQRGYPDVVGLDPSEFAGQIAAEKYGIQVITGSLFDRVDLGKFDCVILTHVLEHIADLRPFLFRIARLLNDGGKVYVEVPDAHNFYLRPCAGEQEQPEHKEPFLQFSVEHVNYFSGVSLLNLMEQNGFEKVYLEPQVSTLAIVASVWRQKSLTRDEKAEPALTGYIAESQAIYGDVLSRIDAVVQSGRPILVWGAGLHTQKLLGASALPEANVRAFVDSDPGYHGATLCGKPIIAPDEIRNLPDVPILISSRTFQSEIAQQIAAAGYPNEVLCLYSTDERSDRREVV